MVGWTRTFFAKIAMSAGEHENNVEAEALLKAYQALLSTRLNAFQAPVAAAFSGFFQSDLPEDLEGLGIEVYFDEPGYDFRVFCHNSSDIWMDEPVALETLNADIATFWPIITQEELDAHCVWEDDPKWGRQVALVQPIDKMNWSELLTPWFHDVLSQSKGAFDKPVFFGVHDLTHPKAL